MSSPGRVEIIGSWISSRAVAADLEVFGVRLEDGGWSQVYFTNTPARSCGPEALT